MLEWIREYLTKRFSKNREKAVSKWKGKFIVCPRIQNTLLKNMDKVTDCIPIKSSDVCYQVCCFDGTRYVVNLEKYECTCGSWQLTGIPCTHAACGILAQKMDPMDFVHEYYSVDRYLKAYENPIIGISYEVLWDETIFIPPIPPNFGKPKRGRKAKLRRPEEDEKDRKGKKKRKLRRQGKTVKCKKCGIEGHNAATCGKRKERDGGRLVDEEVEEEQNIHMSESTDILLAPPNWKRGRPAETMDESNMRNGTQESHITHCQFKSAPASLINSRSVNV